MLQSVLRSLAVFAAVVAFIAWLVGFAAGARASFYRGSQLLSTDVKALRRPGAADSADAAEQAVRALQARMWKSMGVFAVALAIGGGLVLLSNWLAAMGV